MGVLKSQMITISNSTSCDALCWLETNRISLLRKVNQFEEIECQHRKGCVCLGNESISFSTPIPSQESKQNAVKQPGSPERKCPLTSQGSLLLVAFMILHHRTELQKEWSCKFGVLETISQTTNASPGWRILLKYPFRGHARFLLDFLFLT
jgi:hypothetical protein